MEQPVEPPAQPQAQQEEQRLRETVAGKELAKLDKLDNLDKAEDREPAKALVNGLAKAMAAEIRIRCLPACLLFKLPT